jgi:hypothetical protein
VLGGVILAAFLLGVGVFLLFTFMPAVTAALALLLVALSPVILWVLFVCATLDLDRQAPGRFPAASGGKTSEGAMPAPVLPAR